LPDQPKLEEHRFDLVNCALALHHFSEEDAGRILEVARHFTGRWAICSDLERSWLNVGMIALLTTVVMRDEMTRHDARVSSRRAFTFAELARMAREAGWQEFQHYRVPMARQVMLLGV
jgi:2-polyprenyl-3-methyl-5-hydroxy-6-metoxy-1,4-benzoquinol methylase